MMVAGVIFASLTGSCLLLADNEQNRFRYFADRGIAPRRVWLSRQLLAALVITTVSLVLSAVTAFMIWQVPLYLYLQSKVNLADEFTMILGMIALAYTSGQFCSTYIRSGLVSGVVGLLMAFGLIGWSTAMANLNIPLWWSAAPIPFVLLWITWLRAPDWLLERRTWCARIWANASIFLPALVLCLAVICYRVYEIPAVDPGVSLDGFLQPRTAEERATADLYQRAWTLTERIEVPPKQLDNKGESDWTEPYFSSPGEPLNAREVA